MEDNGYRAMSNENKEAITLERILEGTNMRMAGKAVVLNKGAPGVDNMKTTELEAYVYANPGKISQSILMGKYRASPIRRVYIPKENGDKRPLGIPTVVDRMVQQAIAQVLSEEYEKKFSDNSFGFRPNRGCHDAVLRALEYLNGGEEWVIDLDLSKFFDSVNHSKLLQVLSETIKDGRVISLIHKFMRAPISEGGKVSKATTVGVPQGSCIGPVLANILLNELDQVLDEKGVHFVRYADDMVIFCTSKKTAERRLKWITKFLESKLFLKVNQEKTKIVPAGEDCQFLGYSFTQNASKGRKDRNPDRKWFATVHKKKLKKFKEAVKVMLDRRAPGGIKKVRDALNHKITGWCAYFGNAIPPWWLKSTDGWIRRRIRQLLWKQWKTSSRREEECKRLYGKEIPKAWQCYGKSNYWRVSKNRLLHLVLKNTVLLEEGWKSLSWCSRDYLSNHVIP